MQPSLPVASARELTVAPRLQPGLDGLEVARRIRAAEMAAGAAPCRLIAVSADAFEAAAQAARAAGIDAFLTKPVDFLRLDRALT